MIKAFVFDMDGVLIDTESICDKTWVLAAPFFNLTKEQASRAIEKCRGCNRTTICEILHAEFGNDFDGISFLDKAGEFFKHIEDTEGIKTLPYARECLEYLKSKGYKLALASSTRFPAVERHLKHVNLLEFFEVKITGDMVVHSKPDPEIYEKACNALGVGVGEAVAVEDSLNGLISAKTAGMTTIMVPDRIKPNEKTAVVSDYVYENLFKIIENF